MSDRELDAKMAELIFDRPPSYYDCPHFDKHGRILSFCSCPDLPRYSTDIAAAMQVAEKVLERRYMSIVISKTPISYWGVEFHKLRAISKGHAETLPLAICRAARMAAEAEKVKNG